VLPKRPYLDLGIAVLKIDKEEGSQLINYKDFLIQRSVELELILEPGQYLVVPRTTGCGLKRPDHAEAEQISLIDPATGSLHPQFAATLRDIFNKFDLVISNTIECKEFMGFTQIVGKTTVKDEASFKALVLDKYNSNDQGLTLKGFLQWWKAQIIAEGESVVWVWLEKLGYDRDLFSVRSRLLTLGVHSRPLEGEATVEVRVREALATDLDAKLNEMILAEFGAEETAGDGYKVISVVSDGAYSYSYGIKNLKDTAIEAVVDMSQSDNVAFSSRGPLVRKTVKPNSICFMMHAQCGFGKYAKVLKHSVKEATKK